MTEKDNELLIRVVRIEEGIKGLISKIDDYTKQADNNYVKRIDFVSIKDKVNLHQKIFIFVASALGLAVLSALFNPIFPVFRK